MARRIKLVEGKTYHNPYINEDFTVVSLDYGRDKVVIETSKSQIKTRSISMIQPLIQKSVEDQMPGYEQNLGRNNWCQFIKTLNSNDCENAMKIMSKISETVDVGPPDEWKGSDNEWLWGCGTSTKGAVACKLYLSLMESYGREVSKCDEDGEYLAQQTEFSGIVDGRKKSIRLASFQVDKPLVFNHIRQFQEWDDLVLVCVLPNAVEIYECTKEEFMDYIEENPKEQVWIGGREKRERLNNNIRANDIFHFQLPLKKLKAMDNDVFHSH